MAPSDRDPDASESQTLIPHDTEITQPPSLPLRMNLITGTAILAQISAWLIFLTIWYSILSSPIILVSYHPLLTSLGLLLLVNAITLIQPVIVPPSTPQQKKEGTVSHSIVAASATLSFVAGAAVIWWNKHAHSAPHYTSYHGKFGLTTVSLMFVQVLVGLVQYYFPSLLGGTAVAKKVYRYHRVSGYLITALVLVTLTLGTQSDWFTSKLNVLWIWIVLDVVLVAGLVPRIKPSKVKLW